MKLLGFAAATRSHTDGFARQGSHEGKGLALRPQRVGFQPFRQDEAKRYGGCVGKITLRIVVMTNCAIAAEPRLRKRWHHGSSHNSNGRQSLPIANGR